MAEFLYSKQNLIDSFKNKNTKPPEYSSTDFVFDVRKEQNLFIVTLRHVPTSSVWMDTSQDEEYSKSVLKEKARQALEIIPEDKYELSFKNMIFQQKK